MPQLHDLLTQLNQTLGVDLPMLLKAILILVVGWMVARIAAAVVKHGLARTQLDNWIANWVAPRGEDRPPPIEQWVGRGVFGVLMLFVLVAFFQALGLTMVTQPLNAFLNQIFEFAPRLIGPVILILVAWLVASVLRFMVRQTLDRANLDDKVSAQADTDTEAPLPLSQTLSEAVYWLVFLLFLPAILSPLGLHGLLSPVQNLVDKLLAFLPQFLAAGLILAVGWFVARIVQRIVTSLLMASGADGFGETIGLSRALGKQRLSSLLGTVVYVLILIPVMIASLDALAIESITRPASQMLNTMLTAIPKLFAATLVLAVAYMVGKVVSGLASNLLRAAGFDFILSKIGISKELPAGQNGASELVGNLIFVVLMLFASAEAAQLIGFEVVGEMVSQFLFFGGRLILGLIILGIGLYLSKLAYDTVASSQAQQALLLATASRIAILILSGSMALREIGLANEIIQLAFGLTVGAIAVAVALAFGLGARDVAAQQVADWRDQLRTGDSGPPAGQAPQSPPEGGDGLS